MNFEKQIINPILKIIRDNQDYLCRIENLPQLAKLGYFYNTLWYAGRVCWGYDGIIKKSNKGICEDNPKYKLEECKPTSNLHDSYIYDAWGMHCSNDNEPSWEDFLKIINCEFEYSEFDFLDRKHNKTLDDWVNLKISKDYKYHNLYPTRKRVLDNVLCVNGTGLEYKNGYIFKAASGARVDISLYGFWENAVFETSIQKQISKILENPIVEKTIQTSYDYLTDLKRKEIAKKEVEETKLFGKPFRLLSKNHTFYDEKEYQPYYPISNPPYSSISAFDENTHLSYMKGAIEVCKDILNHVPEESQSNVEFAIKFLEKYENSYQ